jgi:2,4-dienoyl-CoA reductase-like NADH-dependent reductase (Old Yellow Enzyme family)
VAATHQYAFGVSLPRTRVATVAHLPLPKDPPSMSLFEPLTQRSLTLRNRIVVSPMCQYCSVEGLPDDWHLVHLGSRAVGGASVVMTEAAAVSPEDRISPADAGLWNPAQAQAWSPITRFIAAQGAIPAVQIAHAGRKASTAPPWDGGKAVAVERGGWTPVAPSAIEFEPRYRLPDALDETGICEVVRDFRASAQLALDAGFGLVEVHAAHGYLLHEFLSPLSNRRDDRWGGAFENRIRLLHAVLASVREVWPERYPLWLRISATDWADGGWDIEQSVALARTVAALGVDLVDVSSGGLVADARIEAGPGYQVPFAARICREAGIATGAVGMITEPRQADGIVGSGDADVVLLAREMLRDPYFPRRAAQALGAKIEAPLQYQRAW